MYTTLALKSIFLSVMTIHVCLLLLELCQTCFQMVTSYSSTTDGYYLCCPRLFTNILEKVIQNKDFQYFALQDVRKHERLMENRLPTLISIYMFIICLPQSMKLRDGRDFCLFSILYLQCLEQCMAHNRCSVNICQMNIHYLVHFLMIYLGMTKNNLGMYIFLLVKLTVF